MLRVGAGLDWSMLGSVPVSGKVVYFALPAAVAWSPPRRDCHEAARELRRMAVLSVRAEITVWVRDETFFVTLPEGGACRPVCDVVEVAVGIVRCNEDLNAKVRQ
jgi:hypothetical protein